MRQKLWGRRWRWLPRGPKALFVALLCVISIGVASSASAGVFGNHSGWVVAKSSRWVVAKGSGGSAYDWPTFHQGPLLQGWASNSTITTANAAKLGVKWAGAMYGGAVDSPMEAYNTTRKERLAYIGTQNGDMEAINLENGHIIWSTYVGSQVRASATVANGAVFLATANPTKVYKLDATTGAVDCTFTTQYQIEASPVAATPPGGVPTIYFGANDTSTASGPVWALNQSNCKQQWAFNGYRTTAGIWDQISYATDKTGTPLLLFGTSDPDDTVYAINALTGKEVWHYFTNPGAGDFDIGAGVVLTPPGVNGFADGMAYVEGKIGVMYAFNLTTGKLVWSVHYTKEVGAFGRNISTPALSGDNLVVGDAKGLVDLNPLNGKLIWHNDDPTSNGVDAAPAIAGPAGSQVVAVGDLGGGFEVDSLATGKLLYHYQCAQYITASPAVSGGDILEASADGFLYDFAVGGGNESTLPTNKVTSPVDSTRVTNPNGNLTVTGKATDTAGVAGVMVGIQASGSTGPWWNGKTGKWVSGPVDNPATVAGTGTSTTWKFSYPVPTSGDTYQVTSYTVSKAGQSSVVTGGSGYTVMPSTSAPQIKTSVEYVAPVGTLNVSGTGFGDSETVNIALGGKQITTTASNASGDVPSTKVSIPAHTPFGLIALTLTGQTSGKSATTGITINNNWLEFGQNPNRTGYEPNDPDIFDSIAAGNGTYMNLAWAFSSPAAVSAPPVVADTVAYIPTSKGTLVALDTHYGEELWTWSGAKGAALNSSPAVDNNNGLVYVAATNGTLYAISTSSGKTVWSDTIGGQLFAPVMSGSDLYVDSSNGTVEAVTLGKGTKVWSKTLANPASVALSLDTTAKTLVVGESNGQVVAMNSTSGALKWSHMTGSTAVLTPAVIGGGSVYVGEGDSAYAINEKNGGKQWIFKTGGTVSNSLTRNNTGGVKKVVITIGASDGSLYGIDAANGKQYWKIFMGVGPITGVASVYQSYVFDTSKGGIGAGRDTSGERLWLRTTSAGTFTSPVVVNGTIYAGGQNSDLYCYTTDGQDPS